MTVYEDAFFSLTDFRDSPGEVLFFPKNEARERSPEEKNLRAPEIWQRSDYDLLSLTELNECVEIFVLARDMARQVLQNEIRDLQDKMKADIVDPGEVKSSVDDLFTKK